MRFDSEFVAQNIHGGTPRSIIGEITERIHMTTHIPITEPDVLWCYRTFLGREPESAAAVKAHVVPNRDLRHLIQSFVCSAEFQESLNRNNQEDYAHADGKTISPSNNSQLADAEFKAGVLVTRSSPTLMTIESSSKCNLRCVMCPHSIGAVNRPRFLDDDIAKKLEVVIRQSSALQLHGIGEPLLSPSFWKFLDLVAVETDASVNSNFVVLTDENISKLLSSNLKMINVSLDAARQETYLKIRGQPLDKTVENIRKLIAERNSRHQEYPHVRINMTLMRSNIEETLEFVELARSLGVDAIHFWHLNKWPEAEMQMYRTKRDGWEFDYKSEGLWNFPELSDNYLRQALDLARQYQIKVLHFDASGDDIDNLFFSARTTEDAVETVKDCSAPWTWAMVTADGDVRPCCHARQTLGNLGGSSFNTVWNGRTAIELRRSIKENKLHPICHDATACRLVRNTRRELGIDAP